MTAAESRALARSAGLLLAASLVRLAWEARPLEPVLPAGEDDVLPRLLAESESLRAGAERRSRPLADGEQLDPNRAPEEELDRLPGVGPSTARAIVETRERGTIFVEARDLLEVRGIGEATLGRIEGHLDLSRSPPALGGAPSRGDEPVIDLNRAGVETLQTLPGVGPALSGRIVELREERGGFRRVEELLDVRGIGETTLERLRPRLRVGG